MRRREFITGVATTSAWPLLARAQQPLPVVGFLNGSSPVTWAPFATAFRTGLKEIGYIEGQNVAIEYRWAEGRAGPLPTLATELVDRKPAVIVAAGGDQAVLAAKNATRALPIVGIGFGSGVSDVSFNGASATIVSATASRLIVTVPAAATTGLDR